MSKYDASKKYQWKPEDTFVFTGEQFGTMLNAFRGILNTPEAAKILLAERAASFMEEALANAVELGIAKEMQEDKPTMSIVK